MSDILKGQIFGHYIILKLGNFVKTIKNLRLKLSTQEIYSDEWQLIQAPIMNGFTAGLKTSLFRPRAGIPYCAANAQMFQNKH